MLVAVLLGSTNSHYTVGVMGFGHLCWVWPEGRLAAFGRSDGIGSRAGALVCRRENVSSLAGWAFVAEGI